MITRKLVFDHRGRTQAGKEGPVELRFIYNGKPYYINTGVKVLSSQFRDELVVKHRDKEVLNERLRIVTERMEAAINRCIDEGLPVDAAEIKRQAYNIGTTKESERTAMYDWLEDQVPRLNISEGTRRRYWVLMHRLKEYGMLMAWSDLSAQRLYDFDEWLHCLTKAQSNGDEQAGEERVRIGDSAVWNYHRTLKSLLSRAKKMGVIDENPYDRVKGEFKRGDKETVQYLSEEEMKAIESLRPMAGTQAAMCRDLFVFQLYTGLSYSDAQAFDIRDYKMVNGRWVNVGERIKTGVAYTSVLLPQAVDVLERYGFQVPKVNNVQYNETLKVIQKALGIRTRLHSHLARHSFATRMLANGAKIENVSAMLGHTNIKQTQRYAKVMPVSVMEDFERVAEKLR